MKIRSTSEKEGTRLDFTATASSVVSQAIGEDLFTGKPLPPESEPTEAQKRGRLGGLKGGKARAEKLTAKERRKIAKKGAKARWK